MNKALQTTLQYLNRDLVFTHQEYNTTFLTSNMEHIVVKVLSVIVCGLRIYIIINSFSSKINCWNWKYSAL